MKLNEYFIEHPKVAVAFSGGVDSTYLLYAAKRYGTKVQAYYVKSAFQPQFELDDAQQLAEKLNIPMRVLTVDVLSSKTIVGNPSDRCYYCKRVIFETIVQAAAEDGFSVLLDGTNASDDAKDRPGMRAIRELSVLSPLRECGLTKAEIRQLSKEAGLFTWDKPAYACLATRIPAGETITKEKLRATEAAENFLFSLGLKDFRVRRFGEAAKIQVPDDQIGKIIENRNRILTELKKYYSAVLLDLEVRE
ncbi:MAG: ATP-dependent sacrificial sulfur transferase LarE [Clostridiales bacterium]|nr:ATP-dependent sacrificial sulfur transferase LarE [Clostridiales bacterium]